MTKPQTPARARLETPNETARSVPPPPPRPASGNASPSIFSSPISQTRSIEGDPIWLDDEDLQTLDEHATPHAHRSEETQRIWRP